MKIEPEHGIPGEIGKLKNKADTGFYAEYMLSAQCSQGTRHTTMNYYHDAGGDRVDYEHFIHLCWYVLSIYFCCTYHSPVSWML